MALTPLHDRVLVRRVEGEEKTAGGLILADETREKEQFGQIEGVLVDASPMAFAFEDWPQDAEDQKPKVGDRVVFRRYEAAEVKGRDGEVYWMMKDKAISGVME